MGTTKDIDLPTLIENFACEDKCHEYLEDLRWPEGVECPRCEEPTTISRIVKRKKFECDSCGYQFSVRVGTVLQDSKLPLWKWFLAIYLLCQSKKGMSANQIKRTIGVSYKTAWFLCHRVRHAMASQVETSLACIVEVDETYIGSFHHVSVEHLPKYLDELEWRFNNRDNPYLFRDTLIALMDSEVMTYEKLTA